MFKKIVKGLTLLAVAVTVTVVSSNIVKAEEGDYCECMVPSGGDNWEYWGNGKHIEKCNSCSKRIRNAVYDCYYNGEVTCRLCGQEHENHDLGEWFCDTKHSINGGSAAFDCYHSRMCRICGYVDRRDHTAAKSNPWVLSSCGTWLNQTCGIDGCPIIDSRKAPKKEDKKEEPKEEPKEEQKEEPARDLAKEAFGGRAPEALSVEEQKTAVSYAINNLRAGGLALPANTVKAGAANGSSDIAAVVADNRDSANQQMFAQVMCQNLGFKNVTPLKTYNMYSLYSSYDAKTKAQTITWANTGLKFGDTAFVVWYNQKLGKIELLPAVVGANGDVAVSVPALGDVSTMTVVKAN